MCAEDNIIGGIDMKNFKLGVIVDSFRQGFKKGVELAAALGADGIQTYMVSGEMSWNVMDAAKISETKKILSDNNIEISAVCGDLGGFGFEKAEDNERKVTVSKKIMDITLELGARIVTTHIGVIPGDKNHERYRIMQDACGELGAYAEKKGMFFAIETGPEPAETLLEFLSGLGSNGMAVNYDPANFVMVTGQDPVQGVHILKDYIVHTHAKDGKMLKKTDPERIYHYFAGGGIEDMRLSDYFLETPLGEGQVDFDAYLAALKEIGYGGYLTVEREVGKSPSDDMELALNLLRGKIR